MSRNDGILYSGAAGTRDVAAEREARLKEKQSQRSKLQPAAELVVEQIEKQKAMLGEILLAIVDPTSTDEQVHMQLEAVRLHRKWLLMFERRIKNTLRLSPSEQSELDKEAEDE